MEKVTDHRQAVEEQRCFIFHVRTTDEWSNYGKKYKIIDLLRWIGDVPDIKFQTLDLLSMNGRPKFALIFEDAVYAKLFSMNFNIPLETVIRD